MTALTDTIGQRRAWSIAGSVALVGHVAVAALVLAWAREPTPSVTEPVVLVELPALAAPAPAAPAEPASAAAASPTLPPPLAIQPVRAPLPSDPVILPPAAPVTAQRQPVPAAAAAAPAAQAASVPSIPTATAPPSAVGADPRAKRQEADYFALVSAHLNRRKVYPAEARQARQQGVVGIRFTVERNGNVSGISLKRSSGHAILDQATLALVQRVAPLPRMPGSMQRDSITLSLPIDYSLRTD